MPNIPLASFGEVQRTSLQARRSADAEAAPFAALGQVAAAIGGAGKELEGWAVRRQDLADEASISRIRLKIDSLGEAVEQAITPQTQPDGTVNEIDYREWDRHRQEIWDSVDWTPDLSGMSDARRQQAQAVIEMGYEQQRIRVTDQANKRGIQEDNAAIYGEAKIHARNGRYQEAMDTIGRMHGDPMQKMRWQEEMYEAGAFDEVQRDIMDIVTNSDDPLPELEGLVAALDKKDKDGNYTEYQRLTDQGRKRLLNSTESQIRAIRRAVAQEQKRMQSLAERNAATVGDINASNLPQQNKDDLISIIQQQAEAQRFDPSYAAIKENLQKGLFETYVHGVQRDDASYQRSYSAIVRSKLGKSAKLELLGMLFDLKVEDLADKQEEGEGRFWDRTFDAEEQTLRLELIDLYREHGERIGAQRAGGLLFNQEKKIREYFAAAPENRQNFFQFKAALRQDVYRAQAETAAEASVNAGMFGGPFYIPPPPTPED